MFEARMKRRELNAESKEAVRNINVLLKDIQAEVVSSITNITQSDIVEEKVQTSQEKVEHYISSIPCPTENIQGEVSNIDLVGPRPTNISQSVDVILSTPLTVGSSEQKPIYSPTYNTSYPSQPRDNHPSTMSFPTMVQHRLPMPVSNNNFSSLPGVNNGHFNSSGYQEFSHVNANVPYSVGTLPQHVPRSGFVSSVYSKGSQLPVFNTGVPMSSTSVRFSDYRPHIFGSHSVLNSRPSGFNPYSSTFVPNINVNPTPKVDPLLKHVLSQDLTRNVIEPFDGTAHKFHTWVAQVNTRIMGLDLSPLEVMHALESNSVGTVKRTIQTFMSSCGALNQDTLNLLWKNLAERYGSSYKIAEELISKLEKFPKIPSNDPGNQLLELHDLCRVILNHMNHDPTNPYSELNVLNYADGMRRVRGKLPDFLQDKWRQFGQKFENDHFGNPPTFVDFTDFLEQQAKELSNRRYERVVLSSEFKNKNAQNRAFTTRGESSKPACFLHNNGGHTIFECKTFRSMSFAKKKQKAFEWRVCFSCLGPHLQNNCDSESTCKVCKGNHISLMHPYQSSNKSEASSNSQSSDGGTSTKRSLRTNIFDEGKCIKNCSKTLLVDLSLKSDPSQKIRCYAIIDEGSNCTLIDEKVCHYLNPKYTIESYSLESSTGYVTFDDSKRVTGLVVQGVNQRQKINLPPAFTSTTIPNSKDEVATPGRVASHPKIAKYASKFLDLERLQLDRPVTLEDIKKVKELCKHK